MKFEFFTIGTTYSQTYKNDIIFGLAANMKQTIKWMYDVNTGEIKLYKSLATPAFYAQLEEYLSSVMDLIDSGNFSYSKEREEMALDWLLHKTIKRESYVGV